MQVKKTGLPVLLVLPAVMWLWLCSTLLQGLVLLLLLMGRREDYYLATRGLFTIVHRPLLYLFEYSGSRIYLHGVDVNESILGSIGFNQAIILANHRGNLDWLVGLQVLDSGGGVGCCKSVIKQSLQAVPVFGFFWWCADFVFLQRSWKSDSTKLQKGFENQHKYREHAMPYCLTIYPEGTRLSQAKLEESQEFARSRKLPVLEQVIYPRVRGTWSAINSMKLDAIYDATLVSPPGSDSKANIITLAQGIPAEVHIMIERLSPDDVPRDEDSMGSWLYSRWHVKDERLRRFQTSGSLETDTDSGVAKVLLQVDQAAGRTVLGAVLWWLCCVAAFLVWCVRTHHLWLLMVAMAGGVFLLGLCAVILEQVHFKKDITSYAKKTP